MRILFGFLWFVAFRIVTGAAIGGLVGAIAGASTANPESGFTASFEAGRTSGYQASVKFFHKYGLIILLLQVLVFAMLCYFRVLPGVGKYKKVKQT